MKKNESINSLLRLDEYLDIFEKSIHRPTVRELAEQIGVCAVQVSKDIKILGLTDMWMSLPKQTALDRREKFYIENYFNEDIKPTATYLARKLYLTRKQVAEDLRKLSKKYNCSLKNSVKNKE